MDHRRNRLRVAGRRFEHGLQYPARCGSWSKHGRRGGEPQRVLFLDDLRGTDILLLGKLFLYLTNQLSDTGNHLGKTVAHWS